MMDFIIIEWISILLQLFLFTPFYLIWRKDVSEIGKENLAISLKDRFIAWIVFCPLWLMPIFILKE